MKEQEKDEKRRKISKGAASGATAIIFLIIGFQAAVILLKVAERPEVPSGNVQAAEETAVQRSPAPPGADLHPDGSLQNRTLQTPHNKTSAPRSGGFRKSTSGGAGKPARKVESFPFDPNRVTLEELVRLGLSEKQAGAILNYREKGGKFRTKADFKKMYTVSDSLYARLEKYIDIPKVELNTADSAALVSLKGIGPYYALRIIAYREALGGYTDIGQLLEIKGMDSSRFEGLRESVRADSSLVRKFSLDSASEERMAGHPYIGKNVAKAIARLRKFEIVSDSILMKESILDESQIERLKKYVIFYEK